MTIFKATGTIQEEMIGRIFEDGFGNRAKVVNVAPAGGGYRVQFNYGADYNVHCGLGKFKKRYPYRIESA